MSIKTLFSISERERKVKHKVCWELNILSFRGENFEKKIVKLIFFITSTAEKGLKENMKSSKFSLISINVILF